MTKDNKISKDISFFLFLKPLNSDIYKHFTDFKALSIIENKLHRNFKFISHRKIIKEFKNNDKN